MPLKAFAKAQRKHAEKAVSPTPYILFDGVSETNVQRCLECVKRFVDEEDDSYESSTDEESEIESDGDVENPYADGTISKGSC